MHMFKKERSHNTLTSLTATDLGCSNVLKPPNAVVKWLTILRRILGVPGSNPAPEMRYPD
jgi:hypothetical protein